MITDKSKFRAGVFRVAEHSALEKSLFAVWYLLEYYYPPEHSGTLYLGGFYLYRAGAIQYKLEYGESTSSWPFGFCPIGARILLLGFLGESGF